ncbi:hypothetical protein LT85_2630 [Collimonas arenae]|uniref:Uncharacterized protein n=1 Tax=Collimonas arenae TaxID=279058 RepID=A0A0A1FAP2_9BURK|nr:hypothetical protein [Collimonas arenae]AIY41788.1 hypothetical protein LT85_2630 [Collimonas arenae]
MASITIDPAFIVPSLAPSEEASLFAYNAAFYELGLSWHWDADTYNSLLAHCAGKHLVGAYVELHQPHLLTAYDADFLIGAIESARIRCLEKLDACGSRPSLNVNWAEVQRAEIGI